MKCRHCGKNKWRCRVYQTVDVTLDKDGFIEESGFDFSDPELEKDTLYCDNCGEFVEEDES